MADGEVGGMSAEDAVFGDEIIVAEPKLLVDRACSESKQFLPRHELFCIFNKDMNMKRESTEGVELGKEVDQEPSALDCEYWILA
jgi:hypothetical protein